MITIHSTNRTHQALPLPPYEAVIRKSLKKYGITDSVVVDLTFVGTARMRTLNRQFRGKDYATDVLSFPIWSDLPTVKEQALHGPTLLGSVVVCLPTASRQAKSEQQTLEEQISFLIDHSIAHLLGFHHEGDE
jgi:probable rRNA maturation factor